MNQKLPLPTINRLLELRATLDKISQISFSFSIINKQYPIDLMGEEDAQALIEKYESLIEEARRIAG